MKIDYKALIIPVSLLVIILGMAYWIIFHSPKPEIKTIDNSKQWQDSISVLYKKIDVLQLDVDKKNKSFDSLAQIKNKVEVIYKTKIKYIENAGNNSLDSLIRSNW